jgi:hypothetical protein
MDRFPPVRWGTVKVVVPARGTGQQSSAVKRTKRALGQMVARSPLACHVSVTGSPASTSVGITWKKVIDAVPGVRVDPGIPRAVGGEGGVEVCDSLDGGVVVSGETTIRVSIDARVEDAVVVGDLFGFIHVQAESRAANTIVACLRSVLTARCPCQGHPVALVPQPSGLPAIYDQASISDGSRAVSPMTKASALAIGIGRGYCRNLPARYASRKALGSSSLSSIVSMFSL